jgi:hypothetical protein
MFVACGSGSTVWGGGVAIVTHVDELKWLFCIELLNVRNVVASEVNTAASCGMGCKLPPTKGTLATLHYMLHEGVAWSQ